MKNEFLSDYENSLFAKIHFQIQLHAKCLPDFPRLYHKKYAKAMNLLLKLTGTWTGTGTLCGYGTGTFTKKNKNKIIVQTKQHAICVQDLFPFPR